MQRHFNASTFGTQRTSNDEYGFPNQRSMNTGLSGLSLNTSPMF